MPKLHVMIIAADDLSGFSDLIKLKDPNIVTLVRHGSKHTLSELVAGVIHAQATVEVTGDRNTPKYKSMLDHYWARN